MTKSAPVLMADVAPGSLVLALGTDWVACTDALPWNDVYEQLRYVVYSPSYCGDMFVCGFDYSGPTWWSKSLQLGITGVTHWRLAGEHEQDFTATRAQLPAAKIPRNVEALDQLKRWWDWFADSRGIER